MNVFDTVIVGGGPAGYTAALYCAHAGLSAAVLETLYAGGQMAATNRIENYPGFDEVDGFSLAQRMKEGAERAGAVSYNTEVLELHLTETPKRIVTSSGEFSAHTVILATGAQPRRLGDAREAEFTGRGLGYCATCDGMFYRGKTVVVAGGGNSAVEEALFLSRICQTVYVVHRRDALRADRAGIRALEQAENVHILYERRVAELLGEETLSGVTLENTRTGERETLACDGLFVAIGREPNTALFAGQVALDKAGYVDADETTRTNLPGVFAAGDVRKKPLRQIVTAAADGAVAAKFAEEFLNSET